ncbi:MAG: hypothetical protein ABI759_22340 [Candidatus Solibacter sp.]
MPYLVSRRFLGAVLPLLFVTLAKSQTPTVAGEFRVEPPTLTALGFEWRITGDDNRTARVDATYRKKGESEWRKALPLFRLQREMVTNGGPRPGRSGWYYTYEAPNMFAGSILNLEPGTEYECRFVLADSDGVQGEREKTVTVLTRAEPQAAAGGKVYHVYPFGYQGERQQPAFTGLMAAYYLGADESDHYNVMPARVQAGDVILLHGGLYQDHRFVYGGFDRSIAALGTPFDGTYYLTQSGTAEKPIVIKAAGDGEVIFDGDGCQNLFNVLAANYNYFEGITIRNTNVAFLAGLKNIIGSSGFTLKHSRLENIGRGVQDEWSGSKNYYIADNVFIGRHDPNRLQSWNPANFWSKYPGFPASLDSEYAVKVYGQGHVVAYNYVANLHDGIDIATYGDPDGTPNEIADRVPVAIDFYNNDFYGMSDNCIEADGGAHNIRVFRNRCFNAAGGAYSSQPSFGGPTYIYQNLAYETTTGGPLKYLDTPAGVLTYQNTFVGQGTMIGPAANIHFRNNLFLGDGWSGTAYSVRTFTNYSTSDYNGFRPNALPEFQFAWNSPAFETAADYKGQQVTRRFKTLKEFSDAAGQDRHSVLLDFDIFQKVTMPNPADPQRLYSPEDLDFRLKAGTAAIDAGEVLPTINDGFSGRAPDLGAYELGAAPPHYGPRSAVSGAAPAGAPRSVAGPPAGK